MYRHWIRYLSLLVAVLLACTASGVSSARAPPRPQSSRAPPPRTSNDDAEFSDDCPEPDGYFADGGQCDKYYECINGKIKEKLCPDGMVFNDYDIKVEKCDLPYNIDCSTRPELQEPKPSLHCPRLNGYFAHEDTRICDKFYFCVDGMYNMIVCPSGLVYNEKTGICTWPDEAHKKGCSSQEVFKFDCPKVNNTAQQHPRYADPEDCQYFYVCINGEIPRRNGCKLGQVFNDVTGNCDWARNVPECADWYKGILTDEELAALERPKPKKPHSSNEAALRRKGARPRTHEVVVEEEEEPVRRYRS